MAIVRINAEPATTPASLVDRLGPQAHVQRIVLLGLEGLVNRRYAEPVYFHPDDFAATLGLDRPALTRALRALTSELPIDYVPPFRGNAIRVIDREPPAARHRDRLRRARRSGSSASTTSSTGWSSTPRRRSAAAPFLLGYFGDAHADRVHCGRCDNCGDATATPRPPGRRRDDRHARRATRSSSRCSRAWRGRRAGSARRWWRRCSRGRAPRRWTGGASRSSAPSASCPTSPSPS